MIPAATHKLSRIALLALLGLAVSPLTSGCSASEDSIAPPRDRLYHPAGLAVDPSGDWLYVANANADLRYGNGSLVALDIKKADALIAAGPGGRPDYCTTSALSPGTLLCDEENSDLLEKTSTVRIGNFAGELRYLPRPGGGRLITAVRGDPSVTWADVSVASGKPVLTCAKTASSTTGLATTCDETHRITSVARVPATASATDDALRLPGEPFGLSIDETLELGYVTHLSTGHVTLLDLRGSLPAPLAIDFRAGFFTANSAGDLTAYAVQPRTPGNPDGLIYLTSRTAARIATFRVTSALPPPASEARTGSRLVPGPTFDLPAQFVATGSPADVRGIAFADAGDRAYVLSRAPAQVMVLDTSIDAATGLPRNQLVDQIEVCAQPSLLRVRESAAGTRVYVVCFAAGQVWVVDPGAARVVDVIDTGRGPNAIAIRETPTPRAYVANFVDATISVIDLAPGPTEHDVLMQIGTQVARP